MDGLLKFITSKRATFQNLGFYFGANVFNKALPFIILPILTLYLVPAEYGKWNLYLSILALLTPLTAMGLPMILGRNYHTDDRDSHRQKVILCIGWIAIFCLAIFCGLFATLQIFETIFSLPIIWLLVLPLICFFQNIKYISKSLLRHENKAFFYFLFEIFNSLFLRVLGLLAVIFITANWIALLWAQIVVQFCFFLIALWIFKTHHYTAKPQNLSDANDLIKMGWPLMPHAIGGTIMTLSDRIILERMVGIEDVGLYSLGANLGIAVLVFCFAFNNQWGPWMHRQLKNPTNAIHQKIVKYSYAYFALTCLLAIAVIIGGTLYIQFLIDPAYGAAATVVPWVAAGAGFYGLSFVLTHYLIILGKTKALPTITGSCAVFNILLTIYLVDLNGFIGAGQATFISYLVFFTVTFICVQRAYPMPWLTPQKR